MILDRLWPFLVMIALVCLIGWLPGCSITYINFTPSLVQPIDNQPGQDDQADAPPGFISLPGERQVNPR